MNRTTFFLIFSMLTLTVHAQHYQHKTFWTRGLVTAPLSKKWDFFGEYIHRQQNEIGSNNPFSHASFQEVRLWGYYKYKNWVFQVNPYTFIHSVPFLGKPADYNANPNFEHRVAVGAEVKQVVGKFTFKERFQYEYRFLKSLNYVGTARARLKGSVEYDLAKNTKLRLSEEYWFNVPPRNVPNRFDQNWISLNVAQQITPHFTLEFGYRRNQRERNTLTEFDEENGLDVCFNLKF